ncbi:MAG: DASS family sodium-coupled anion symporter [Crocinitomicaceae bacterium]|nr:DASS family sodium-coupled anion symporter [Crocinitomicaceae bacterium]
MQQFNWKQLIAAVGVLLFVLILLFGEEKEKTLWNAIALGGLMIYFWVFEAISIYITALLPLILAIPLGILNADDLAAAYGNGSVYLFFGGFVLALGLEKWKVHEQVARGILAVVGDSKPRILLGFLLSTGFLSMWISNTATALMMLPMAIAIIQAMPPEHQKSKFSLFLMLSIAYAASIGGLGTLIGSPPNTQMAAILSKNFNITVSFFDWMKVAMPMCILLLLLAYLLFYIGLGKERKDKHDFKIDKQKWTVEQLRAVAVFGFVALLWIFKDLINEFTGLNYRDENAAILGAIILFIIPQKNEKKPLLEWHETEKLPWGILLLFGGGLALAAMLEKNGIVAILIDVFKTYKDVSILSMLTIVVLVGIFASEVLSNLALVVIFIPVVAAFAKESGFSVIQLSIALTFGASCAFMMPVGTPPNAIAYSSGYIKIHQMIKYGFVMNLISAIVIIFFSFMFL